MATAREVAHTNRMGLDVTGDFVVAPDDLKNRCYGVAAAAGMTAVGVALLVWGGLVGLVVGSVAVAFFGLIGLPVIVIWAIRGLPPLIVTDSGFTVHRYALDLGFIAWDEVASIDTQSIGPLSRVTVTLRDPAAFLGRHRPLHRALLRLNGKTRLAVVGIPSVGLQVSTSDLAAIMEAKRNGPPA